MQREVPGNDSTKEKQGREKTGPLGPPASLPESKGFMCQGGRRTPASGIAQPHSRWGLGAEHAHVKGWQVGPLETDTFRVEPVRTRFAVRKKISGLNWQNSEHDTYH